MTNTVSRAAMAAGIAIGASALAAVPADATLTSATNAVTTPTYYVAPPMVGSASNITPESADVSAVIDTGGDAEALLPIPTGGLSWGGGITIPAGISWADNTTGKYVPLGGIPVSGASSDVSVTVSDAGVNNKSPVVTSVSNAAADNYSAVVFEYDPVADYVASGNAPGMETDKTTAITVPTAAGLSSVQTEIGAFSQAEQTSTGNTPLRPNTQYYFWITQQPGGTDAATEVNVAQWAAKKTNPTKVCLPNIAIALDSTLADYSATGSISYDGTTAPELAGPCVYYYGDPTGKTSYQSPNGEFTTPALGRLIIGRNARVSGRFASVTIRDRSAYKASGEIELDGNSGAVLARGKFTLAPGASGRVKLKLTRAGVVAAEKRRSSQLLLTSNWDQPSATTAIRLLGQNPTKQHRKPR